MFGIWHCRHPGHYHGVALGYFQTESPHLTFLGARRIYVTLVLPLPEGVTPPNFQILYWYFPWFHELGFPWYGFENPIEPVEPVEISLSYSSISESYETRL